MREYGVLDTNELFQSRYLSECRRVHRFMTYLMVGQFLLGMIFALFWAPFTWIGEQYEISTHVWGALFLGGSLSSFAVLWMRTFPNHAHTRHIVAITQVLWSALLIHLSGGRIETHFHVFVSLAILSIYRDWKILISATVVVAIDHVVRGIYFPLSAFGVLTESPYRWMEHAAWVVFEIAFLAPGCLRLRNELYELCVQQTELEIAKRNVDIQVKDRTRELRQTNERLKATKIESEKLALVAKYTDNAVVITDGNSRIEWANAGFTRITGFSASEASGQYLIEILQGDDEGENSLIDLMLENPNGFNTEVHCLNKQGDPFWLAIDMRPIRNEQGTIVRFIAIQNDITVRKQMELSIKKAEQSLRSIMDNVPGALYRREVGNGNEIKFISHRIEEITGYSWERFNLGTLVLEDIVLADDLQAFQEGIQNSIENGQPLYHEFQILDDDGQLKWLAIQGQRMVDPETDQVFFDCLLIDINERVLAEQENQRLHQELIDMSRQAGIAEVATGVLHNVGNVLNSVNVSASVINKRYRNQCLGEIAKSLRSNRGTRIHIFRFCARRFQRTKGSQVPSGRDKDVG